jgi:UDP-galactopyranose mutase
MPILKETFEKTKTYFINLLWDSVKEEFTCRVKSTVEFIETFFESPDYKEKEKAVIDTLFKNVNLPLFLKPFKPLLKKILKKKLRKLVEKYLKKLDAKF